MLADLRLHPGRARESRQMMTQVSFVSHGAEASLVRMGDSVPISINVQDAMAIRTWGRFTIKTHAGTRISHITDSCSNQLSTVTATHSGTVSCRLSDLPLLPGRYFLDVWLSDFSPPTPFDMVGDACWFEVFPGYLLGSGKVLPTSEGPFFMRRRWSGQMSSPESSPFPESLGFGDARGSDLQSQRLSDRGRSRSDEIEERKRQLWRSSDGH